MVTLWTWRVVYTSACLSDVPSKYRDDVRANLRERGLTDCGN
ncbi:hypothetical protein [Exiguobacterium sp.]|nr:hypothetical protein [Exiguobacterium sp.]